MRFNHKHLGEDQVELAKCDKRDSSDRRLCGGLKAVRDSLSIDGRHGLNAAAVGNFRTKKVKWMPRCSVPVFFDLVEGRRFDNNLGDKLPIIEEVGRKKE